MLVLNQSKIAGLMQFPDYIRAVEQGLLLYASGKIDGPSVMEIPGIDGIFHIKGAGMRSEHRSYVAVKINGNFPENKTRFALPTIQGAILLCDATRGTPLAFLDSMEITMNRTGAATAIAAKYLARSDSRVATICGCGVQGSIQLRAIMEVLSIQKVFAFDRDPDAAKRFSQSMPSVVHAVSDPVKAIRQSDVIVTCTTARKFFVRKKDVRSGTFIAAVGADSHDKQEIDPALLASSKVVTDITDQCARIGDLHHAMETGAMNRNDIYAELHELVSRRKPGRTSDEEITIFDSTGTAIQDVASAAVVYERALSATREKNTKRPPLLR
jgi:alanine dehydrogenase